MKIKLTESKLNQIVSESVKKVLNENTDYQSQTWDYLNRLKDALGAEQLCDRLIDRLVGQIDWRGAYETLRDIYDIEVASYMDEEDNE